MRMIRYSAWAAIAALVLATGLIVISGNRAANLAAKPSLQIGGPFTLTTHEGKRLSSEELKGKPFAIFFGFTFCPEICPATLLELTQSIAELGKDADKMRYLFVTVDPERDTPEHLALYLSSFDPRIIGLTGTPEEIASVAKAYRIVYEKVPTGDDYTMNHTALVYLMDAKGEMGGVIAYGVPPEMRLKKLRELVAGTE
jgi:protein SCO1/2